MCWTAARARVLAPGAGRLLDRIIADAVRIKAEVVTADEREGDLRRILNFGHTFGHALEAETKYERLLHGEAVAWGMRAATLLAERTGHLRARGGLRHPDGHSQVRPHSAPGRDFRRESGGAPAQRQEDCAGQNPFVLPVKIGEARIVHGVDERLVLESIEASLQARLLP